MYIYKEQIMTELNNKEKEKSNQIRILKQKKEKSGMQLKKNQKMMKFNKFKMINNTQN